MGLEAFTITESVEMVRVVIGTHSNGCGHTFYMTREHYDNTRTTAGRKTGWWCPVCGIARVWTGESNEQRLQKELDLERKRKEWAEKSADQERVARLAAQRQAKAHKGVATRIKNRVAKGVCPCCNRTFIDLQRHMATKHADYVATET